MQHVENDMEDLFKRAGDNYSPQKGKGDWESIARRIVDKSDAPAVTRPSANGKNKKAVAFFLLLLIISGGLFIMKINNSERSFLAVESKLLKSVNTGSPKEAIKNISSSNKKEANASTLFHLKRAKIKYKTQAVPYPGYTLSQQITVINYTSPYYQTSRQDPRKEIRENDLVSDTIPNKENYSLPWLSGNELLEEPRQNVEIIQQGKTGNMYVKEINKPSPLKKIKNQTSANSQQEKGMYVGLVAAPDFSKVQSPSFNSTGFNAGLLLGFSLNTKLSFESGIIWNKKKYSSEAKNFKMDRVSQAMPTGMIINNIESQSSVIEIPLKVKYDIVRAERSSVFISSGVSSYIMTKENNRYHVTMNGSSDKISSVYKKNNYSLPAVANVSIGYEQVVSRHLALRIEPFLKVPLRGIGVGSLPVTSAGLQVGITSRLK